MFVDEKWDKILHSQYYDLKKIILNMNTNKKKLKEWEKYL